jgi:hypothetical protein
MFVRFRQNERRQQVSLLETRRTDGKVRNEHVASLSSVEMPHTIEARIVFWQRLHERLAKLSNRVDAATQGKILTDVHARIPMVTVDEQRSLQIRNAEADEQFWTTMRSMFEANSADLKQHADLTERKIADVKPQITNADVKAATARDRMARIKNGETVSGGLGKPQSREDIIASLGLTKKDLRRFSAVHELCETESDFQKMMEELHRAHKRSENAAISRMLRRKRAAAPPMR